MTRTPNTHSSTSSGTTTYGVRSRSSSRLATTNPTAPPAFWRSLASPSSGCGLPLATWTMPRIPKARATQPTTWRPAGPLRSGSRMLRQPMSTSTSGTSQPTLPTDPATTVRTPSITVPGSCHQTAAAATTASPMTNSPTPSRRCSGSRSRAPRPIERASEPSPWAIPSHTAATPRPSAAKARKTGPGPLRTARGAGLRVRVGARLLEERFFLLGVPRVRVPDAPRVVRPDELDRPALGRAPAPRTRRGRRTGRHDTKRRPPSLQSHGPHGRVGARPHGHPPQKGIAGKFSRGLLRPGGGSTLRCPRGRAAPISSTPSREHL